MKHKKIFRILAIAITLSLLVMVLPAASALAAEKINVSPNQGKVDDDIDVSGSGFDEGEKVYIYFSNEKADVDDDDIDDLDSYEEVATDSASSATVTDEGGDIDADFDVPDELDDGSDDHVVTGGEYYIYATENKEGKILAKDEFTVYGITKIDPTEGPVGTEVEIEGVFEDEEDIEVFYEGDEVDIESGDTETEKDGEFKLTIIIPPSAAGANTIQVEVKSDEGEVEFTVVPGEVSISATSGMIGDRVTISGTGFGASSDVTVTFGDDEVATGETDSDGNLSIPFDVPAVGAGKYVVEVKDDDGNSAKFEFTMATDISIGPVTSAASPGHIGMDITISGTGFKPNVTITITYASTPTVFTTTSEADGSFSYTFEVPKSDPGEHTITATDGVNSLEATFFMESDAPAIPEPLLPAMGDKPEQPITFDWRDVSDPSGVTYTLQVATDKDFNDIVFEEVGLTETKYTLETELESTKKDEPYWWRVKAIDGVGNESGWTGAGSFDVGFVFEMPTWAIFLLIGLGGVALFFIGFFLGRRTGYAY
jgi:hypothetical protein